MSPRVTVSTTPLGRKDRAWRRGPANSASRWRQPPHGVIARHPLGDHRDLGDLAAAGHDIVAERRGLGAPAFRIGGDLDIGSR